MIDRRQRERISLTLPVRLRWHGPCVQLLETTETLDVSRTGLLVLRRDPCRVNARLWVRYLFDSPASLNQAEMVARVAHVKAAQGSGFRVGLCLEAPPDNSPNPGQANRRIRRRVSVALPVRARRADIRWPEETMTADVSEEGARFPSARFYTVGDPVRIALIFQYDSWELAEERFGHVVRVESVPDSALDSIAVVLALPYESRGVTPTGLA